MKTTKIEFEDLHWVGNHYTFKFRQDTFPAGFLNLWFEYSDLNEAFVHRHMDGHVSGFSRIAIKPQEDGQPGTNIIYMIDPVHHAPVPGVEINPGESVIGIMDCDFKCLMRMSFRPSPFTTDGMVVLFEREI